MNGDMDLYDFCYGMDQDNNDERAIAFYDAAETRLEYYQFSSSTRLATRDEWLTFFAEHMLNGGTTLLEAQLLSRYDGTPPPF